VREAGTSANTLADRNWCYLRPYRVPDDDVTERIAVGRTDRRADPETDAVSVEARRHARSNDEPNDEPD
jgi:hypothetical protein